MARKIVVTIPKGGAGKTTTAVNLATALQLAGKKTLLVDLDPGADATLSVGLNSEELTYNINHLFTTRQVQPEEVITTTAFGLDIMPGHSSLGDTEAGMQPSQIGILRSLIAPIEDVYDMIVIDTPNSKGYLPILALAVATDVVIPLQAQFLAFEKIAGLLNKIDEVKRGLNDGIRVDGILPVMIRLRTNMSNAVVQQAKSLYPHLVYPIQVNDSTKHSEATTAGVPIVIYEPSQQGSLAYMKLAERFN